MKIDFYIEPRRSGKTTKIIQNCMRDDYGVLIVHNMSLRADIIRRYRLECQKPFIFTVNDFMHKFHSMRDQVKAIYIDEYEFFSPQQKAKLYDLICYEAYLDRIEIRTTPTKTYKSYLFNMIKEAKKLNLSPHKLTEIFHPDLEDEVEKLFFNFITEPQTKIHSFYDENIRFLSEEMMKIYFLAKWID